jgi:hypothetical protein
MRTIGTTLSAALCFAGTLLQGQPAFPAWSPPGENLAKGRPYEFVGPTSYNLTREGGTDATDLADGKFAPTEKFMWFYPEAVVWPRGKPLRTGGVIFDLGEVRDIGGLSYSTDSGEHAAISHPPAIVVFVSDDGKTFTLAGELVALYAKYGPPPPRGRHRFVTDDLNVRGRYVQLQIQTASLAVCDEIEIYAARPGAKMAAPGSVIENPRKYASDRALAYAVSARVASDAARAREVVASLGLKPAIDKKSLFRGTDTRPPACACPHADRLEPV